MCVRTFNCLHNPIYKEEAREFDNLSSRFHINREYCSVHYRAFSTSRFGRDHHWTSKINRQKFARINSNMFIKIIYLISAISALASAAPKRTTRSTIPIWHMPCGENSGLEVFSLDNFEENVEFNFEENIEFNFETLRLQHQLTMNDYLYQDYEYLYEGVSFILHDRQYIPNWLPDKKDTDLVRRLTNANSLMVSLITKLTVAFLRCAFEFWVWSFCY